MNNGVHVLLLGASHHSAPIAIRERLAVPPERQHQLYQQLRALPVVHECVLVNTCNRLEVYAVTAEESGASAIEHLLCAFQNFPVAEFAQHRFTLTNHQAVRHLLEVSCGTDSQIVGETEIFGQIKSAYSSATAHSAVGAVLNRVFQKVFHAAKHIRSSTPIGAGQVSVATVAVDLAGKIFGELADCRVLVVGTGEVGEKTAKALHSRGVTKITVLSRTAARAEALAAAVGARSGLLDGIARELPQHDIVVGCTTTTDPVITEALVQAAQRARRVRPLFLIDLGIPRNFDPATADLDSVFLYDLDDLARIADENLALRRAAVDRCRVLAREKADRIWEGVSERITRDAAMTSRDEAIAARQQTT